MHKRSHAGFTLIELMITVAIIGILAAIALPSYQQHVLRTRRVTAGACLMEMAQFMERQYATAMSYAVALPTDRTSCDNDLAGSYVFAFANTQPTTTTYTINATPSGAQSSDTRCGTLSITQAGVKGVSGTSSAAECWR
ncbi:type IV pilin protein [Rhodoferax sp. U11-2br]|uniref:type IV pilin protein n=1 Tax=Rhodoferax sp. U11-2br TaxID=2838878 RepID=UPI001BEB2C86|nr:type IV pilin protein [Rhodoferax sp. U11-2br]MBT3066086.1 type IV pilin protein [Rhodoferax sp. U11-2br]